MRDKKFAEGSQRFSTLRRGIAASPCSYQYLPLARNKYSVPVLKVFVGYGSLNQPSLARFLIFDVILL
jgi:hypothetical protein